MIFSMAMAVAISIGASPEGAGSRENQASIQPHRVVETNPFNPWESDLEPTQEMGWLSAMMDSEDDDQFRCRCDCGWDHTDSGSPATIWYKGMAMAEELWDCSNGVHSHGVVKRIN